MFGGASKNTLNIRSHQTLIKNPAKIASTGKQAHSNRAATQKKGSSQKQSGSTATPETAATKPTPVVRTKKSKDTAPTYSQAPAAEVEVQEDLTKATATTDLSPRNTKNDYLVKGADRLAADPARHLNVSPKKAANGLKKPAATANENTPHSNAVSSTFAEKIEQKLEEKLVKRGVKAVRKNKSKKVSANEKDRREFRSVY